MDLVSEIKCLHSAVGLLPKKLPIQIVRWGGSAWYLLGSHERAFHFLTVVARALRQGAGFERGVYSGAVPRVPAASANVAAEESAAL